MRGTLEWVSGLSLAFSAVCVLVPGVGWVCDVLANLAVLWVIIGLVVFVASVAWQRWVLAAVSLSSLCACGFVVLTVPVAPRGGTADVRLMVYNAHNRNSDLEAVFRAIVESDADVVVITEQARGSMHAIRREGRLSETYPHQEFVRPVLGVTGWVAVLSRWPLARHPTSGQPEAMVMARVERPSESEGPFWIVAAHPQSPRTPARWRIGNRVIEDVIESVESRDSREPVVVAADFNATKTGWRSRRLASEGLVRAQPSRVVGGTYPSWLPALVSLGIDDVAVSGATRVVSWTRGPTGGSDHRSVIVELDLPDATTSPHARR